VRAASWPRHRIVVTGEAYEDRWIELGGEDHQHGPQGQQQRGMMVAQTWMDPLLAIDQTRTVSRALAEAMPQYAPAIGDRGVAWEAELAEVDRELKAIVMGASRPSVIVAGPKYRYLIRRYGINAVEVGGEDGQIDLVAIDAALDRVDATTILVGEQLDQETLAAVASRRLKVFVLPVAVDASSGERLSGTYRRMIDLLAEIHGSSESQ
jgi:ABC-type Zn uptake system ZnuABC Zn-binding protein ZnuA